MPENAPNIFPAIRYNDGPAALAWLARAFGFTTQLEVPAPDGRIAHAEMRLGPGVIMLGSATDQHGPDNPWDKVRFGVYVRVEDVDAHYQRARAAGAEIVRELKATEYGSREYSVRDLEGNLWSFGTYRPGGAEP
jgi:uncharacterized glyoxalase superfamily protein PhnB